MPLATWSRPLRGVLCPICLNPHAQVWDSQEARPTRLPSLNPVSWQRQGQGHVGSPLP